MGESFVDLSYQGLELGKRIRLSEFRTDAGYVELPLPMPVGTRVEIATDDGMRIQATVTAVHEQVAGVDQRPGMRVQPVLEGKAKDWWSAQVDRVAVAREEAVTRQRRESQLAIAEEMAAKQAVAGAPLAHQGQKTTVMSTEAVQQALAAEGLADDGKRTETMSAVVPDELAASGPVAAAVPSPVDESKATTVMDAIDISMITGEAPPEVGAAGDAEEAEITIEAEDGDGESSSEISTEIPASGSSGAIPTNGKRKRGSRRRKKR